MLLDWDTTKESQSMGSLCNVVQHIQYMKHMGSFKKLICFSFFNLFVISTVTARVRLPPNVTVSAAIVFGDSIVDAGNNNNRLSISKCNFLPYGRDFMGGIPTGRFSNGKVPSDLFAAELGLKSLVPAYLDPNLKPNDLLTGVNFASGGAGFDPLTSQLEEAIPLDGQLGLFKDYITKLNKLVGAKKTKFILNNAIYVVVLSSNDIANAFFGSQLRQLQYDVDSYTSLLVEHATTFLKQIYALGARRVGVFSAPPLGCVPSQRTVAGGPLRECADKINEASKLYNSKLDSRLTSLTNSLPNARFVYVDIYYSLLDIIQNYPKYGFEVANLGCCGTGNIEVVILCNQFSPHTCPDASKYVFWDSFHPTERAYEVLTKKLLTPTLVSKFV